jgi:hypothetical protein
MRLMSRQDAWPVCLRKQPAWSSLPELRRHACHDPVPLRQLCSVHHFDSEIIPGSKQDSPEGQRHLEMISDHILASYRVFPV